MLQSSKRGHSDVRTISCLVADRVVFSPGMPPGQSLCLFLRRDNPREGSRPRCFGTAVYPGPRGGRYLHGLDTECSVSQLSYLMR